jgi:glycine/D-amino acid oxidase-like deaminating enzyme
MDSYYLATAGAAPRRARLEGRVDAEVCVVGAGFAGLATAYGLLERGVKDVAIVEAETVAHGASGRNGGFVFGGFSLDCATLAAQQGPERARAMYALTCEATHTIRRRIAAEGIECDAVEGGALLANWFQDDEILARQQRVMATGFGVDWRTVSREEMPAWVRTKRYTAGLLEADAFHFHPLKYARGLALAIERRGGRILERSPVTRIEHLPGSAGHVVHTATGAVHAKQLVVTGGGYLRGRVVPPLERAMLPIATYVMVTEPLGAALDQYIPGRAAIYDTRFSFDYYRPLPDTRILWGGRISIRDREPRDIARFLKGDLLKVFPDLQDLKVEYAWGGLMSYSRHGMPQIGRLPDGTWHGIAFGGHGVAPTTAAGELLADAISGTRPIPPGFADYGLTRVWGAAGKVAAQAQYSWAETRDWWNDRRGA